MPFVTEEIYQNHFKKYNKEKSIHISSWSEFDKKLVDEKLEKIGEKLIEVISEVRKSKATSGKSLKEPVKKLVCDSSLKIMEEDLKAVTHAEKIEYGKELKIEF